MQMRYSGKEIMILLSFDSVELLKKYSRLIYAPI